MVAMIITFVLFAVIVSDACLKPNIFKYLNLFISSIFALVITFNYFEVFAGIMISRNILSNWAYSIDFIATFGLSLGIIWTIANILVKEELKLNQQVVRLVSSVFAILFTIILSGVLIVGMSMAPIGAKFPYKCYNPKGFITADGVNQSASSTLFPTDKFVAGAFNVLSKGSLSNKTSFGDLNPNFINGNFLNRISISEDILTTTGKDSIIMPKERAEVLSQAHAKLRDLDNNLVRSIYDDEISTITLNFGRKKFEDGGPTNEKGILSFTPSQITILYKDADGKTGFTYPVGYIDDSKRLVKQNLNSVVTFEKDAYGKDGVLPITFVYTVKEGAKPYAVKFRQNTIYELPVEKESKEESKTQEISEQTAN